MPVACQSNPIQAARKLYPSTHSECGICLPWKVTLFVQLLGKPPKPQKAAWQYAWGLSSASCTNEARYKYHVSRAPLMSQIQTTICAYFKHYSTCTHLSTAIAASLHPVAKAAPHHSINSNANTLQGHLVNSKTLPTISRPVGTCSSNDECSRQYKSEWRLWS